MILLTGALIFWAPIFSQSSIYWHWKDLSKDGIHGISLENATQKLSQLHVEPKQIIVAILDGGIDTTHSYLKNALWINPKEIPNNQIDEDKNGYIDDINGWNFLGGKDGRNIHKLTDEKSRIYHAFKAKYTISNFDSTTLNLSEKKQYRQWLIAANEINFSEADQSNLEYISISRNVLKKIATSIVPEIADSNYSLLELSNFQPLSRIGLEAKLAYIKTINILGIDSSIHYQELVQDLDEYIEGKEKAANAKEQAPAPIRAEIVKDDYANFFDNHYGNKDIMGPSAKHGTHVAGIVSNQNPLIKIMGVRVVPDGDEYDKDIALGIRYAVDNGAKIINMSFGKSFSPEQYWVDSAIRYAASKDVLLIHAAGNEKYDLNTKPVFPNPYSDIFKDTATNMITVAASSDSSFKQSLLTDFSNFGNQVVDIIAPGDKIYSSLPNNKFGFLSGTSMATPVVSHLAALLMAYYPSLSAESIKKILILANWKPSDPSTQESLAAIAKSGGILNAEKAIDLANTWKKDNPIKKKISKK